MGPLSVPVTPPPHKALAPNWIEAIKTQSEHLYCVPKLLQQNCHHFKTTQRLSETWLWALWVWCLSFLDISNLQQEICRANSNLLVVCLHFQANFLLPVFFIRKDIQIQNGTILWHVVVWENYVIPEGPHKIQFVFLWAMIYPMHCTMLP